MNAHKKWLLVAVAVLAIAALGTRLALSRNSKEAALLAQQATQKTQATVELAPADLLRATRIDLALDLPISGTLKAVNSAFIKARVAGDVQMLTVREGDSVQRGQVIVQLDPQEYQTRLRQAKEQAASAKGQFDIAQRNLDNNRALVTQGFISKTALDATLATVASTEATFRAAQAAVDLVEKSLADTVLRAPIAGLVAQRLVQPGERVSVDARMVEIVDLSRLELEASLSASDSIAVRAGQTGAITVEGLEKPIAVKVVRVNPNASAGSRAVVAYLSLEPRPGLRQGLFAQGVLAIGTTNTLAVPVSAVRTDEPRAYVQVLQDGRIVHQGVDLGARGGQAGEPYVAVRGLTENAQVLRGAVGTLRAGTPARTSPAIAQTQGR